MSRNFILATDSYKQSHFKQYPPGIAYISSYIEARSGGVEGQVSQFFGLQAYLEEYLSIPVSLMDVLQAQDIATRHGVPFNFNGWMHIVEKHKGMLPVEIQALPEGALVPRGTPLVQIRNTDPECAWIVSFIETSLLRAIWYPTGVATKSIMLKTCIYDAMLQSCDTLDGLPFKLHDFGARGVSSSGTATLGGMAHLVNFQGTDTMEGLIGAMAFYGADMAGFSLPASEHSTMTSWGKASEVDAYQNMLDQFGNGLVSIVSDSYDLYNAVEHIFGEQLKDQILEMDGKLIVRPDSGDPIETPIKVLEILWDKFGGTVNSKGYRVLHPKVGVIQGDGLNDETLGNLLLAVMQNGFSIDNIAFGMGGGLLQDHMRDDMRFAMKVNAMKFANDAEWRDVQKKPATDPTKTSKAGRQAVFMSNDGEFITTAEKNFVLGDSENALQVVWRNGEFIRWTSFDQVRATAHQAMIDFHQRVFPAREATPAAAE